MMLLHSYYSEGAHPSMFEPLAVEVYPSEVVVEDQEVPDLLRSVNGELCQGTRKAPVADVFGSISPETLVP